jgi:hypothetical protein
MPLILKTLITQNFIIHMQYSNRIKKACIINLIHVFFILFVILYFVLMLSYSDRDI